MLFDLYTNYNLVSGKQYKHKPKFHCRRQSGMNFGYVTVNGVNSNENGEYLFVKEETFDEFLSLLYHEHTKRK